MRTWWLSVLLAPVVVGCVARAMPRPADSVAGCYTLRIGTWDDQLLPGYHPDPALLPDRVQLDTAYFAGWPHLEAEGVRPRVAHSLSEASADPVFQFRFWQPVAGDSLYVGTPLPSSGFHLKLHQDPNGLQGRVVSFTDHIRPGRFSQSSAPVVLWRVKCP